jgi:hypothetical protein
VETQARQEIEAETDDKESPAIPALAERKVKKEIVDGVGQQARLALLARLVQLVQLGQQGQLGQLGQREKLTLLFLLLNLRMLLLPQYG